MLAKLFLEKFGSFLSYILPLSSDKKGLAILAHIYTGFISRHFMSFGKNSLIAFRASNLVGLKYIKIGNNVQISAGSQITAWKLEDDESEPYIEIGDNCNLRDRIHVTAVNSIIIGNNLLAGTNVLITDNSHGTSEISQMSIPPEKRKIVSKGPIKIGDNVWIGNNVCILPGVTIGDGVIIGANSVVTRNIPANCVAAGIPAKIIKQH